jgi:PAS domain S-box-containing protein
MQWRGLREDGSPLPNESFPFWVARYTGEPVRNRVMGIYPSEGPPRWIQVSAQPLCLDCDDDPYAVLASFADITEQKLSEEALRASKDMLSSVLVSSLDGIMVFSAVRGEDDAVVDFEWLLANPKASELVGHPADELMGKRLLDVFPGHRVEGLFDDYVAVVETGEPLERELYYEHEGIEAWLQVIAVQLSDGVAVTVRDITERKEATQAMAATNAELEQRNQTLREFAYIASHDLQEPLRKISAFADLMREDYQDAVDETGEYYLERMQDAAERMSTLINDLLAYSRVTTQTEPYETVDLNEILDNVCSDLEIRIREVGGRIEAEDLPRIEADPTQMRQLLQNLIGNALKFHREGVPPVVHVSATIEQAEAPLDEIESAEVCRLVISDNGIGIEEKYADRIFTPFKRLYGRSQYEGTGMGLAICQRIAQRHGGRIELTPTSGPGSTFTVVVPTTQEGSPEPPFQRATSTDSNT